MSRLFISLYIVIIIGLTTINWGSEIIWHQFYQSSNNELLVSKQLAKTLASVISTQHHTELISENKPKTKTEKQSELKTLLKSTQHLSLPDVPLSFIEMNDIAWLPEQLSLLEQYDAVSLFDANEQLLIYVKLQNSNKLLAIGPIHINATTPLLKYFLLACSYLALACFLALWTRPIWRDLNHLSDAAKAINNHQTIEMIKVTSHSPISPIVNTINNMTARISHLISEQKQLVNSVSHELRTPLSRLRFSFAMLTNVNPQQQREIEQDIEEIATLVDEMLSYSRIEHLAQQQQKDLVNISELLANQIEKHQRGTHIILTQHIVPPLFIHCNGELIERACQNLITNAIRHAKQQVIISASHKNMQLVITVEDDGLGIPEQEWLRIFEPFHRLEKSRNKKLGGYGLGLAIVKKAAEWHQGICSVSASQFNGAKFTLTIPEQQ